MNDEVVREADRIRELLGPGTRVEVLETKQGPAINLVPDWHKGSIEVDGREIAFELRKVTKKGYYNVKIGKWIGGAGTTDELLATIDHLAKKKEREKSEEIQQNHIR